MANEQNTRARGPKAQEADGKRQIFGGRSVLFPTSGEEPFYEDTGEIFSQEEHDAIQTLTLGKVDTETAWAQIRKMRRANPSILFWVPEYKGAVVGDELPSMIKNPIRGVVLAIFEKPLELRRGDKRNKDGDLAARWCAFVMLTAPCKVKNRDKAIIDAKPGDVVWVDLNHSIVTDVRKKFSPRREMIDNPARPGTKVERTVQLFEIAIDPKGKTTFQSEDGETLNAWRMNLYAVPRPPIGLPEIEKIKCLLVVPSVPGEDDFEEDDAPRLTAKKEPPALTQGAESTAAQPAAN